MNLTLTPELLEIQKTYRAFVDEQIMPVAEANDQAQNTPDSLIELLGEQGFLDVGIPANYGGVGMEALQYGLQLEQIGRASASLVSLLTVHGMAAQVINRWGSDSQKRKWLPELASGKVIGAFALSEPNIGSDANNVETQAVKDGNSYVLSGKKKWISFAQSANVFILIAQCQGQATAFLMPRDTEGLLVEPVQNMLGFRSAMLGEITLDECRIPAENMLGRVGFGFTHVAGMALDQGRYCIAWGSLGMMQCCVESSISYAKERKQFGVSLSDHQLIQHMLADMLTQSKAARLMCYQAAILREAANPRQIMETSIAKYFVTQALSKAAADAVQIHGANGCSSNYPVQRHWRDAKIMEIIEGSNQIQQMVISAHACQSRGLS